MDTEADQSFVVTFHDIEGTPVGGAVSQVHGRWQRIPPIIAAKLTLAGAPPGTSEQFLRGEMIALFRTGEGRMDADLWAGTAIDAWAKASEFSSVDDEPMAIRVDVACDAYVLKADGTIEQ